MRWLPSAKNRNLWLQWAQAQQNWTAGQQWMKKCCLDWLSFCCYTQIVGSEFDVNKLGLSIPAELRFNAKNLHYMEKSMQTPFLVIKFHPHCEQVHKIKHIAIQSPSVNSGSRMGRNKKLREFKHGTLIDTSSRNVVKCHYCANGSIQQQHQLSHEAIDHTLRTTKRHQVLKHIVHNRITYPLLHPSLEYQLTLKATSA